MIIRESQLIDKEEIVQVLKASLGEDDLLLSSKIWEFKHEQNPFGKSLVLVAEENDKIIGVRALMKWHWQKGQDIFAAYRAVDTATHPDHQGKGIFKNLTLKAIENAVTNRDKFIFNTPNEQSRPGYLKMGWKTVGNIKVGIKPAFNSFYKISQNNNKYHIKKNTDFDSINVLCEKWNNNLKSSKQIFTPKNAHYLKWRYEVNPLQAYEVFAEDDIYMAGYIKFRGKMKELRIAECIYLDIKQRDKIMGVINKWSKKFGAQFISYSPELMNGLLWGYNGRIGPNLILRKLEISSCHLQTLLDINKWSSSLGDLELF
jgi:predicted acetyltransferase